MSLSIPFLIESTQKKGRKHTARFTSSNAYRLLILNASPSPTLWMVMVTLKLGGGMDELGEVVVGVDDSSVRVGGEYCG